MLVYRFKPQDRSSHRVALTIDASGANLPADGAPWQQIGQVDLSAANPWVKAPVAEIEQALSTTGCFVWSVSVPNMKPRFVR